MATLSIDRLASAGRQLVCELARLVNEESLFSDIERSEKKFFKVFDHTLSEPGTYLGLKAMLRLTRAIERWANGMGVAYILYHAAAGTNPPKRDRCLRKLGMTGNYHCRLSSEGGASG